MRRNLIFGLVWATAFAVGQTPPKADRSAEPRLKQVFAAMSKLKSLHAEIGIVSRSESRLPYYPVATMDFHWQNGVGFRMELTGTWGDGQIFVSDGKTLLVDSLYVAAPVTLKDAKPAVYDCDPGLAQRGGASSPLFYLLNGDKGFTDLVAADGDVVACKGEAGEEGIRFKSTKLGTMRVFFNPQDRDLKVIRIDYDDLENKTQLAIQLAEWGYTAPVDPLDVQTIRYVSVNRPIPKPLLLPAAPTSMRIQDERAKKPASPPTP